MAATIAGALIGAFTTLGFIAFLIGTIIFAATWLEERRNRKTAPTKRAER